MATFIVLTADQAGMPWVAFALDQYESGVRKAAKGQGVDSTIQAYWRRTTNHQSEDESETLNSVAWCSAAVNACMIYAGVQGTGSGWAASWKSLVHPTTHVGTKIRWLAGEELASPRHGAVMHLSGIGGTTATSTAHVGLYVGETATHYISLGGNQANAWTIGQYAKADREYEFAWPKQWGKIASDTLVTPDVTGNYRRLRQYANGLLGTSGADDTRASKWGARLKPMPLTNGTYVLPNTVLSDTAHEEWWAFLGGLPTRADVIDSEFVFYDTTDGS